MPDSNPRLFARCALGLAAALLLLGAPGILPSAAAPLGSVIAWGDNSHGQLGNNASPPFRATPGQVVGPGGVGTLSGVQTVAAAFDHSLALKQDGTVWAWGNNAYGQLGDGTTTTRSTPVQVLGPGGAGFLTGVTAIAAGGLPGHNLALKQDGTVYAWGDNSNGQLGDGTVTDRHTPVQVLGPGGAGFLTGVSAVSVRGNHNLALKQDGTVWSWGYNYYGQLGDGTTTERHTPVQVVGPGGTGFLTGVQAIAAGYDHSLALKTDGTVWAWGWNYFGQLGDGTTTERHTPVQVVSLGGIGPLAGVTVVAAGEFHSLAIRNDNTVLTWGSNGSGELGDGNNTDSSAPVEVVGPGGSSFLSGIAVLSAYDHTVALRGDGTIYAWGSNRDGRLGDGTTVNRNNPRQVVGPNGAGFLANVTDVAAGAMHSLAVESDGTVWAWGYNGDGELGNGTYGGSSALPVGTAGLQGAAALTGVRSVAAGGTFSLALDILGQNGYASVLSWGQNNTGQLGDPTNYDQYAPVYVLTPGSEGFNSTITGSQVSAGSAHGLAKSGGEVYAWGNNSSGQIGDGTTATRYVAKPVLNGAAAVAAGEAHSLAVMQDGTVWAWGDNVSYPTQVVGPNGAGFLTGVMAVAAGNSFSLALRQDGTVWTWSGSEPPVQEVGPGGTGFLTGITAIAAGNDFSLALKSDGTVWAWGQNTKGELGDGTGNAQYTPVQVVGAGGAGFLTGITAVAAGGNHSLALEHDGTVWAWGDNGRGELGNGAMDADPHPTPSIVLGSDGINALQGVSAIAAGGQHSLAVQSTSLNITGFSPGSGHVGDSVTLSGNGFTGASAVMFNGVASSFSVDSDSSITATVPLGASTGPISVTTSAGTASSAALFIVPAPSNISFNPTAGSLGSMVTITGTGFTGASSVNFNGAASSFSVNSDTSITTYVPYSATTGPVSIYTPAGIGTSATNFTVNAPAITSFDPSNCSVGATVNITGSAFTAASAVKFNGVSGNYVLNSDTSITATVPFGATTGPISVISPAGTGTSATNFTVNPPIITGFSPTSGPIGSFVTLTGSSFTGVTDVQFGGVSANFFYSSDTQINAAVPPGFVSGPISVTTPAGTATTAALTPANFTVPGPVITDLSPNNGSLREIIVITGTGFTSATAVTFNGVSANYYINLDSQIVAFVPDTATTGPVTVTTPSGTSPGVNFTVNPPVITGIDPTHGSLGSYVTISGSGFTLASGVKFGGVDASFFVSTDTSISATVPAGFVSGKISVTGPIGTGTSADTYTVDAPAITDFSPASGPAGTNVTVNGSGFTGATSIQFNGVTASLFVANDGQISTTVPAGATTGPITVTGPGGTGTSAANFMVQ